MNYTITYHNDFSEPYIYDQPDSDCQHISVETYKTDQFQLAKRILTDLLDAPFAKLSIEEVKKDFSSADYPISEEKAIQIQNYYNGRLALHQTIVEDLNDQSPRTLRYDIPQKYNAFSVNDEETSVQNSAYIEIVISDAKQA